jgi:RNA polymerase sigma-70 factor, ECF subfamily
LQKAERDLRTPATTLENREQISLLREVIGLLPEEQKLVIIMKEYQGLKFHEISEILGIPLSTAKSRMYLGLKTIRRLMEEKL